MFGQQTHHDPREMDSSDEVEDDDSECVLCSGNLVVLGTLGNRVHLRCRNCGMDQSKRVPS